MTGDRRDRTALRRMHCRHAYLVFTDLAQHRFLAAVRLGAKRCALEHLAEVIRLRFREAMMDRRRRENAAIAAAPADDHVGALLQQVDERVDAGHRDNSFGRVELRFGERRARVEAFDDGAATHASQQRLFVELRIEIANVEARQPMLRGKLADDSHVEIDAAVRAGVARRSDDHRHAEPPCREQHVLEVLRLPSERARRRVGTKRHRPDVIASRIGRDVIGLRRDASFEAFGAKRRKAKMSVRTNDA